jgi:GDP-L-fucose synthase
MKLDSKFFIVGNNPMGVNGIARVLKDSGCKNVQVYDVSIPLLSIAQDNPDYVFYVMGDTLLDIVDVLYACKGVPKLICIVGSNVYCPECPSPVSEDFFGKGYIIVDEDDQSFKQLASLRMCQEFNDSFGTNYIPCICADPYGSDPKGIENVIDSIMRTIHSAKLSGSSEAILYVDPEAQREYIYWQDFGVGALFIADHYNEKLPINLGSGQRVSARVLANLLKRIIGYEGELVLFDPEEREVPCRLLDCRKLQNLGWMARWDMINGLKATYSDFLLRNPS